MRTTALVSAAADVPSGASSQVEWALLVSLSLSAARAPLSIMPPRRRNSDIVARLRPSIRENRRTLPRSATTSCLYPGLLLRDFAWLSWMSQHWLATCKTSVNRQRTGLSICSRSVRVHTVCVCDRSIASSWRRCLLRCVLARYEIHRYGKSAGVRVVRRGKRQKMTLKKHRRSAT